MIFSPVIYMLLMLVCAFLVAPGFFQVAMGYKEADPEKIRRGDIMWIIGVILVIIIACGPTLLHVFSNMNQPAQVPAEQTCICGEALTEDHICDDNTTAAPEVTEPDTTEPNVSTTEVCTNCGAELVGEFCHKCGAAVDTVVKCAKCGLEAIGEFCHGCGTQLK